MPVSVVSSARRLVARLHAASPVALGLVCLLASPVSRAQDLSGNETARRAVHVCASCHGESGRSTQAAYPSLAGQPAQYLERQLQDFRAQQRSEADTKAYMWGVSALLDDNTIQALSNYYAAQTPPAGHGSASADLLARGRKVFEHGAPGRGVRACAECHGSKAEGAAGFPRLAGQHASYIEAQIKLFRTNLRPHGVLMKREIGGLGPADAKAVAAYLQSMN